MYINGYYLYKYDNCNFTAVRKVHMSYLGIFIFMGMHWKWFILSTNWAQPKTWVYWLEYIEYIMGRRIVYHINKIFRVLRYEEHKIIMESVIYICTLTYICRWCNSFVWALNSGKLQSWFWRTMATTMLLTMSRQHKWQHNNNNKEPLCMWLCVYMKRKLRQ